MMELQNSLGCKMCKKPLERCEPVNKTNTRRPGRHGAIIEKNQQSAIIKFEGTFRQQLMQGAKAEELDPVPVAARCGHIFHNGCIKKMTTELNSSCIECPICTKPVTLTNVWQIDFYHPEKDGSKRARTLSSKVHSMNEKNNTLQEELIEVRRLRSHKEVEYHETVASVNNIKQTILQRRKELDEKLIQIFGAPSLDEKYEENVRMEKEAILQRVKELTNRNSELLASIEERAKTHYINETENMKDDPVLEELENSENNKQTKHGEKVNMPEITEIGDTLNSSSPTNQFTATLKASNSSSANLKKTAKGDTQSTLITTGKVDDKNCKKSSRRKSHQISTQEALFDALRGSQDASSTLTSCMNITNGNNNKNNNHNNSSTSFQNIDGNNSSKRASYPIPMATVTKSMQELFEQEKLKYLLGKSREESRSKKDKEERQKESISQDRQHCITSNTGKNEENESIERGSEESSASTSSEEDSASPSSLFPGKLKPKPDPGIGTGTNTTELMLSQQSRKVIPSESHKKDKEFPIFEFKYHESRSGRSSKDTGENITEKMSKSYFENATGATTKSPNYQHHHQCHRQPSPLSKPLAVKNLKFKPSKVSVKGKSSRLKSQPPSQIWHRPSPSVAEPQKAQTKYVLNMTQQKRQRWKRLHGEESNIDELNLTGKPFYGHNNI